MKERGKVSDVLVLVILIVTAILLFMLPHRKAASASRGEAGSPVAVQIA